MADPIKDRIERLGDFEHRHLVHMLSESHPKILKSLLDRLDDHRRSVEVREAMPPHPFTPHDNITGLRYCYLSIAGTPCLRDADHPVHSAAEPFYPDDDCSDDESAGGDPRSGCAITPTCTLRCHIRHQQGEAQLNDALVDNAPNAGDAS